MKSNNSINDAAIDEGTISRQSNDDISISKTQSICGNAVMFKHISFDAAYDATIER